MAKQKRTGKTGKGGARKGAGHPTQVLMLRHLDGSQWTPDQIRELEQAMERFAAMATKRKRS